MRPNSVLVIDDDPLVRGFITSALEADGYSVAWAVDGQEALRAIAEMRPDVIILDLLMPTMDGREFLESCRQDGLCRDVPIIVVSAARQIQDAAAIPGVKAALAKPFDTRVLLGAVERLIGDRGQGRQEALH